ncbi:MAG: hypothetical protein HC828_02310 [Blastochloris sp.]|nr:hypothetical protein [Blastochloris sp.]
MNLFKHLFNKIRNQWYVLRHWYYNRGHAEIGQTIFYRGSCYEVIAQQHTHTFGPPELQVIKTLPLPEADETYLFKSEYQTLAHPHPPTTLTGINRCLYTLYHLLFANQFDNTIPHLHFARTKTSLSQFPSILHEEFAPLPYQRRIVYWRPIYGRWFLHTSRAAKINLNIWSDLDQEEQCCKVVLQDSTRVARAHVLGEIADAAISWHDADTYSSPF